ncbi:MAG: YkgJ family cysteine cluster protein [Phormidium sp. GEM2.Bin31]|nr:YkgJ family cysteine cluster protein [Phormidium sp. BM_Day4_Bin.17]TVR07391.1 MAG: YkgJ family cysteine cluster protein [Phormidium sp. GEM2.Bin31]UCJ13869.1 MAG: YkgJ family cysteine cluster protein [Phormidium sp. PBR-2020]
MATWQCVKQCGACCYLAPQERPDLDEYLSPEELKLYLSLVGDDGWCQHYDHDTRECGIYEKRPGFCRVDAQEYERRYDIDPDDLDEFAIDCCREHIGDIYGDRSLEMIRFDRAVGKPRILRPQADS